MLVIAILLVFSLSLFLSYSLFKKRTLFKISRVLAVASGLVLIVSILFLNKVYEELTEELNMKKWEKTEGEIVVSKVVGQRAAHPFIQYKYKVGDTIYANETDMGMPGFGGKKKRRATAEELSRENFAGKKVLVYYNPGNPEESALRVGPQFSVYMKLAFFIFVMILSISIVNGYFWQLRQNL